MYHKTDITGYRNTSSFAERTYEQSAPTQDDLDELIHADSGKKLLGFAEKWTPFTKLPMMPFPPDIKEEIRAISDTRDLMLLVLRIKSLLDNGCCSCDALREIGFRIDQVSETRCEYGVVCLPISTGLPEWVEERSQARYYGDYASSVMPPPVSRISEYTGEEIKRLGLHLPWQEELAESLDDSERHKVFEFGIAVPPEHVESPYNASWIMDEIMGLFLEHLSTFVEGGVVGHRAGCNMLSFWLLVSERFETSRVQLCRSCGLPLFATAERGAKRLYCNEKCERKFRRAKQFGKLVNEEGATRAEASKRASIAASTAERILLRNGLPLRPAKE